MLQAEDDPQQGRLAGSVRTDQAGELPRTHRKADVVEDLAAPQRHAHMVDLEDLCGVGVIAGRSGR
jgi:hypothetical protein